MRSRTVIVIAVVAAVATLAAILSTRERDEVAQAGEPLFPALLDNINDVVEVDGTSGGEAFTLARESGRWVVPEKSGYPADPTKARQLVLGTAQLARVEPKTSNPDLYSELGLGDVDAPGGNAVRLVFKDAAGGALADMIVGNDRPARGDPEAVEYYVREPGDSQVWLVQGKIALERSALAWLDETVLSLERPRVRQVRVSHADGTQITVRKPAPWETDFELVGMPAGMEPDGVWKLNDMGKGVAEMELADVLPASEAPVGEPAFEAETLTFDGLRVVLEAARDGERTLATLRASFDPQLVVSEFMPRASEGGDDTREAEARAKLRDAEAVREEAERLNARWTGWVYVVPKYRVNYLTKRLDELLKKVESPTEPAS